MNRLGLALIPGVTPDLRFIAMQQIRQHVHIGHRCRRRANRVHDAFFGIHADVRLHAEIPLIALPSLVHLQVALPALVLGRRGRRG